MLNLYFFSITISNLMENNEILTEQSLENSQISESEANQDEITFEDLGLDENIRGEKLSIETFGKLSEELLK